ncbi:MAG: amidohydrolase family protein [Balneolaceae bacterium]
MSVIDSHQHFWQYHPSKFPWINDKMKILQNDFMPPDLKQEMDRHGVNGCVAVQAGQTEGETEFLLKLAKEYPFVRGVVGWLDLAAKDLEKKLEHYTGFDRFKGLRHIVHDEPDDRFLLRPDFLRGIEALGKYDLCYDILIFARHLSVAIEFAGKFPDQKFVLDHIAKPEIMDQKIGSWEKGIRELAKHPRMVCKVSGMVTEADWNEWEPDDFRPYLDVVFDAFGTERLMFGSDWPVCKLAATYGGVIQLVEEYIGNYNPAEQEKIMGLNAVECYEL